VVPPLIGRNQNGNHWKELFIPKVGIYRFGRLEEKRTQIKPARQQQTKLNIFPGPGDFGSLWPVDFPDKI